MRNVKEWGGGGEARGMDARRDARLGTGGSRGVYFLDMHALNSLGRKIRETHDFEIHPIYSFFIACFIYYFNTIILVHEEFPITCSPFKTRTEYVPSGRERHRSKKTFHNKHMFLECLQTSFQKRYDVLVRIDGIIPDIIRRVRHTSSGLFLRSISL